MTDIINYSLTGIVGGGADDLDGVDPSGLVGDEFAFVCSDEEGSNKTYVYKAVEDGAIASFPDVIVPVAGTTWRWHLFKPSLIVSKPLLHIQDQKTLGVNGGSSSIGDNFRDLNTILINEISGASLSSNDIPLPIGEYWMEANGVSRKDVNYKFVLEDTVGDVLAEGVSSFGNSTFSAVYLSISGRFSITLPTTVRLNTISGEAIANDGLGKATNLGDYEVYVDIKIWKLDSDKEW